MKSRLLVGLVGAFLLLGAVASVSLWLVTDAARNAIRTEIHRAEQLVAAERATELGAVLDRSRALADSAAARSTVVAALAAGDTAALRTELSTILGVQSVIAIDAESPEGALLARVERDRAPSQGAAEGLLSLVGEVPGGGQIVFTIALAELVPNLLLPLTDLMASVTLVDLDGRVLATGLPNAPAAIDAEELLAVLPAGGTASYYSEALDEHRIGAVARVAGEPLAIVVGAPSTLASGPANELVRHISVIVAGAASLTGLMLAAVAVAVIRGRRRLEIGRSAAELLANTDPLTGVANRRGIETAVAAMNRPGAAVALLLLDLDDFKRLNDQHGHAAGDVALRRLGHELTLAVRPGDVVGRWGGDEFVLLLPPQSDVVKVTGRVREAVGRVVIAGHPLSACIGTAVGPPVLDDLLGEADASLYREKRSLQRTG